MTAKESLTYKAAGVNIDAGSELVSRIKESVARTSRPEVIGGLGGFGGLFKLAADRYDDPILVSGTDGVGTKLKLVLEHDAHDEIGIDLVAMCANDVIVLGAEPLFFLDYFVTPQLDVEIAARVIKGIARGCELAGAALIGGETAEHPGMHAAGEYDLAGFCVGVVDQSKLVDGRNIRPGDSVIGLGSSGKKAGVRPGEIRIAAPSAGKSGNAGVAAPAGPEAPAVPVRLRIRYGQPLSPENRSDGD